MASKYKIGLETKSLVMVCDSGQDVNVRNRNYKKKVCVIVNTGC